MFFSEFRESDARDSSAHDSRKHESHEETTNQYFRYRFGQYPNMKNWDFKLSTRLISGAGSSRQLGRLAREQGFTRSLLVTDSGLADLGYLDRAANLLSDAGIQSFAFHDFASDPDSAMIAGGSAFASPLNIDSIIAFGGGSSLDCAKGINFLLTNGGRVHDYQGYGKASKPMLPMIAVPTTAGTGSEVQSYAVISDAETHRKMACGAPGAAFKLAILDPELTLSQPRQVTAASGFDAIAHAVETYVATSRTPMSEMFSRQAWRLLESNYETVLRRPDDLSAREAMQLGACWAGIAIENSMLGATHACANPLTAHYCITHGAALAMLLPSVVRWNGTVAAARYAELLALANIQVKGDPVETLAQRLEELAASAGLVDGLSAAGVPVSDLPLLAAEAAQQWTGSFNPRPFDLQGALEVYESASRSAGA
ncbi:MAG: alcohol dehydrogenase [Blastocatellia bacterium]|nr:alcohol dehydrogenase [Blastocatellia bacterium]